MINVSKMLQYDQCYRRALIWSAVLTNFNINSVSEKFQHDHTATDYRNFNKWSMLLRNFNIRYHQCYWDSSIYDEHYQNTSIYDPCYCEPFIWFVRLRCVQLWLLFADVSSVELPLGTYGQALGGLPFRPPKAWPLSSKEIFLLHQCCKSISGSFMLFNCFTLISVRV